MRILCNSDQDALVAANEHRCRCYGGYGNLLRIDSYEDGKHLVGWYHKACDYFFQCGCEFVFNDDDFQEDLDSPEQEFFKEDDV